MYNESQLLERAGRTSSLIVAFSAWSFTPPASIALGVTLLLFLADARRNWKTLSREPAVWLLMIALLLTTLLALRAAYLFSETADQQLQAITAWSAPLCFIAVAWWVRGDRDLVWRLMIAAFLGLVVGILRRTDWTLLPQILEGMRYHFNFATTSLAFLMAVCLVGLLVFRSRILRLSFARRTRTGLLWALWLLSTAFVLAILVVTQSRGAALVLVTAGVGYLALDWVIPARSGPGRPQAGRSTSIYYALGLTLLAMALLWVMQHRQEADLKAIAESRITGTLSYESSFGARVNFHRAGLQIIAARPLLGWGPGTSSTEYVTPRGLVALAPFDQQHLPDFSHLHSAPLEIMARFGSAGALFAVLVALVVLRALAAVWRDALIPPDLRLFLALTGLMTLVYSTYDFRLMNHEFRYFSILYLGIVYGLYLAGRNLREHDG